MIEHTFVCDNDGALIKDTDTKRVHICPKCGEDMRWDLSGQNKYGGDYEHFSESLAIHPDQIPEHKKLFPSIDVMPDGVLRFTSVKQQERYANRCGFEKKRQRIKTRGTRIV